MTKSRRRSELIEPIVEPATHLSDLPYEILNEVVTRAQPNIARSRGRLAVTCSGMFTLFRQDARADAVKKAIGFLVKGFPNQALKIIERDPESLRMITTGFDLSFRKLEGTFYRMSLGMGYYSLYKRIDALFEKIQDGKIVKANQFMTQFSDETQKEMYDFAELMNVIAADPCTGDKINEATAQKLLAFKDYYTPNCETAIKQGEYFDLRIFVKAAEVYKAKFLQLTELQQEIYCEHVLAFLQKLFTTPTAQALCQGLINVVLEKKRCTQGMRLITGTPFFAEFRLILSVGHANGKKIWQPNLENPEVDFLELLKGYIEIVENAKEEQRLDCVAQLRM